MLWKARLRILTIEWAQLTLLVLVGAILIFGAETVITPMGTEVARVVEAAIALAVIFLGSRWILG